MTKVLAGKKSDFPAGSMKQVRVEGKDDVVVANVGGKFYAMRGICNHSGGHLGEGELDNNVITCPLHGSKWDITTGKMVEFTIDLDDEPTYKVVIEGENIFVDV